MKFKEHHSHRAKALKTPLVGRFRITLNDAAADITGKVQVVGFMSCIPRVPANCRKSIFIFNSWDYFPQLVESPGGNLGMTVEKPLGKLVDKPVCKWGLAWGRIWG